MEFYQGIFGGELETTSYDEVPDMPGAEDLKGMLMNASLIGGTVDLRGADSPKASPETKKVELCFTGSDEETMRKIFEGLSEGGNVKQPLQKMFWGDTFGQLTDKYGVDWMMNITQP
jgi:PhnB protein